MDLVGKRIVITGAASGIGKSLLALLQALPMTKIIAADLEVENIVEIEQRVYRFKCDLSYRSGTDDVLNFAKETLGGVDLFFANAGFAYYEELPLIADWSYIEKIYATNTLTPIYTFQKMRELAAGQEFRVVVTASSMGYLAIPGYALYGATKASLTHFAKALRWELQSPCALTLVNPIATRTKFFGNGSQMAPVPFPSQSSDHVARTVLKAVIADKAEVFPSVIFQWTMFFHRFLPLIGWLYQWLQSRSLQRWTAMQKISSRKN